MEVKVTEPSQGRALLDHLQPRFVSIPNKCTGMSTQKVHTNVDEGKVAAPSGEMIVCVYDLTCLQVCL